MVRDKHIVKKCEVCIESYQIALKKTKKIKNKRLRKSLLSLWKTLWLNDCEDLDIVAYSWDI